MDGVWRAKSKSRDIRYISVGKQEGSEDNCEDYEEMR
jgi:hypothetical protein